MALKKLNAPSSGRNPAAHADNPLDELLTSLEDSPMPVRPLQLQPIQSSVYQLLFELNAGFEAIIRHLEALQEVEFLRDERLTALRDLICRSQAEANRDFMETLMEREMSNAAWFDHLCIRWERQIKDPSDVLIEAEHYKEQQKFNNKTDQSSRKKAAR